jgi:hypothetical protein
MSEASRIKVKDHSLAVKRDRQKVQVTKNDLTEKEIQDQKAELSEKSF